MEFKLRRHPSGAPRDPENRKREPTFRIPDDGFVTPRLREQRRDLSLIGFGVSHEPDDE